MAHTGTQQQISGQEFCEHLGMMVDEAKSYCDSSPINIDGILSTHEETQYWFDYYVAYLKMDVWASFDKQTYVAGDTIKWRISATNTCDTALPASAVSMSVRSADGAEHGASAYSVDLSPGSSTSREGSWVSTVAQVGSVTAQAQVVVFNGKIFTGNVATARVEAVNYAFDISMRPSSTPADGAAYAVGETITWDVVIANTGNVPLTNMTLSGNTTGSTIVGGASISTLAVGASITKQITYTVKASDNGKTIAGAITAAANGVTHTASAAAVSVHSYGIAVKVAIANTGTGINKAYTTDDEIKYTITITNNSDVALTNVDVSSTIGSLG